MVKTLKIVVAACILCVSCGFAQVDLLGRNVQIKSAEKLVFIGPGALRLGVYLGLVDRIVGIERFESKINPEFSPYSAIIGRVNLDKAVIVGEGGPGKAPSAEALVNSGADLIISSFVSEKQIDEIQKQTRIPVFAVSYGSGYGGNLEKLESVKKSIVALGEATNTRERASKLIKFMEDEGKSLKSLKLEQKSVYVGGIGYKGAWGIASTESDYLPFWLLGIKNAVNSDKLGHLFIDMEKLVEIDPDVIFLDKGGKSQIKKDKEDKSGIFDALSAFKNGRIHWVDPFNYYNTNIENCFFIAWQVAKALGADIDLDEKKRTIYDAFLGKFE